jgi:hypothetical protein
VQSIIGTQKITMTIINYIMKVWTGWVPTIGRSLDSGGGIPIPRAMVIIVVMIEGA